MKLWLFCSFFKMITQPFWNQSIFLIKIKLNARYLFTTTKLKFNFIFFTGKIHMKNTLFNSVTLNFIFDTLRAFQQQSCHHRDYIELGSVDRQNIRTTQGIWFMIAKSTHIFFNGNKAFQATANDNLIAQMIASTW